ncbi:MAG: sigma 54-interacting transcriptional regulator [Parcubacteria group bacterium]
MNEPALKVLKLCDNHGFVGSYFRDISSDLKKIALSVIKVLIVGEPGTGKELIARAIHKISGNSGSFVVVNCSAIPENLFESELFGHTKGAFTGATEAAIGKVEMAKDGTLFLDEIGDLPVSQQPKLLRMIEYGEVQPVGEKEIRIVRTRIISATNKNLEDLVKKKMFRQDLHDRLVGHVFEIAPLRERLRDLPALIEYFLNFFCDFYGKDKGDMAKMVANLLKQNMGNYCWPGNVRELRNFIEKCVVLDRSSELEENYHEGGFYVRSLDYKVETKRLLAYLANEALKQTKGNKTKAIELLNISYPTLLTILNRKG